MEILKRPLITEKVTQQNGRGVYGFIVEKTANKIQIKEEVESMYGVVVAEIRTMRYLGKKKSRSSKGGVVVGRKASFKKALVQLKEGDFIDFYSNETSAS